MIKSYVTPAEKKTEGSKPKVKILINEDWCKGCGICIEFCPNEVLKPAGFQGKPTVTDPTLCNKCLMCEVRCPDFAIRIRSEEDDDEDS